MNYCTLHLGSAARCNRCIPPLRGMQLHLHLPRLSGTWNSHGLDCRARRGRIPDRRGASPPHSRPPRLAAPGTPQAADNAGIGKSTSSPGATVAQGAGTGLAVRTPQRRMSRARNGIAVGMLGEMSTSCPRAPGSLGKPGDGRPRPWGLSGQKIMANTRNRGLGAPPGNWSPGGIRS
jgi:hypothetical protein